VQARGRRAGWRARAPRHRRGRSPRRTSARPGAAAGRADPFCVDRGRDAPPLLLAAARRLETLDAKLSRETYLDAFSAALFAGRLAQGAGVHEVAEAVLAANWAESGRTSPRASDLLLEGMAVLTTQGFAAGAPTLKRALSAFRDEPMSQKDALRWLWLACRVARALGDDASWDVLTDRQVRLARAAGALSLLPIALIERFGVELFFGDLDEAQSLEAEAEAVVDATGSHLAPQGAIALAAWRGSEEKASALIEASALSARAATTAPAGAARTNDRPAQPALMPWSPPSSQIASSTSSAGANAAATSAPRCPDRSWAWNAAHAAAIPSSSARSTGVRAWSVVRTTFSVPPGTS
jgi:hypothetical protein